jgi:uncharacterized protein YabN with tetrapyrrole methylase and pyrophosphatase domain
MLNSLNKLMELEKDAAKFGFEWPDRDAIIKQAVDECREIQEAIDLNESEARVQEEIGDLLHAVISLCRFSNFDIEETIAKVTKKFKKRITSLKEITKEHELNSLQGQSTEFMLNLWDKAKIK